MPMPSAHHFTVIAYPNGNPGLRVEINRIEVETSDAALRLAKTVLVAVANALSSAPTTVRFEIVNVEPVFEAHIKG